MRSAFGWSVVGLLTVACIGQSTAPNPDHRVAGAVQGQITDESGVGVAGPLISVSLASAPVAGVSRLLQQGAFVAGDDGRFVVLFVVDNEVPQTAVLLIHATPPPGSGLSPRDSTGLPIPLSRTIPPPDTAVIVLELPPR